MLFRHSRNRIQAFTLIELLVVIAIIAILAAILFPVFSQAKESAKKIQSVSNLKQIATAVQMYLNDNDDTFPNSMVPTDGTAYNWNRFVAVPLPNTAATNAVQLDAAVNFVFNNMQPYMKNYDLLRCPAGINLAVTGFYIPTDWPGNKPPISYTFNGNLNAYPSSAVASPSDQISFWNGRGKSALIGAGYLTPFLICNVNTAPCRYVPPTGTALNQCAAGNGGASSIARTSGGFGFNVFNGGANFAFADSSAKFRKLGTPGVPGNLTDPRRDPFAQYDKNNPTHRYWDSAFCHPYLFRPDFDFQNWGTAYIFP